MKSVQQSTRWQMLALLLAAMLPNTASAVVIDDFSVGPLSLTATAISPSVSTLQAGLDPMAVVGGSRDITIQASGSGAAIGTHLEIDTMAGELRFSSDPEHFGYLTLTYGEDQPLGLDLSADGDDRLVMRFSEIFNSGANARFFGLLEIASGTGDDTVFRSFHVPDGNGPQDVIIPFADFGSVDYTDVNRISMRVMRYGFGSHFTLTQISTVPEPTGFVLLGLGALCLVALRRKRAC